MVLASKSFSDSLAQLKKSHGELTKEIKSVSSSQKENGRILGINLLKQYKRSVQYQDLFKKTINFNTEIIALLSCVFSSFQFHFTFYRYPVQFMLTSSPFFVGATNQGSKTLYRRVIHIRSNQQLTAQSLNKLVDVNVKKQGKNWKIKYFGWKKLERSLKTE